MLDVVFGNSSIIQSLRSANNGKRAPSYKLLLIPVM
jgi:hypothetical protein